MVYQTKGVCARQITFDLKDENGKKIVRNVNFVGGCSGNTQGVARLVEGMEVNDAVQRMEGISCNGKPTSCPDQLARAIKLALEQGE